MVEKMEDHDKPFACSEPGCGMQFTNEDHLAVHMRKHDMSLALNLSGTGMLSPTIGVFTDQTPTPTKFLKNLEEMGLFQELTKNPFDDSFKKAMDDTNNDHGSAMQISLPVTDINDLDTPQPPLPRIVIGDEDAWTKGSDKTKDTLSSIVPKKRKKFLRQQSMPTSTTSEDESESVIGSSMEIGSSSLEVGSSHTEDEEVLLEVHSIHNQVSSTGGGTKTMTVMSSPSSTAQVTSSFAVGPQNTSAWHQALSPALAGAQTQVQPALKPLTQQVILTSPQQTPQLQVQQAPQSLATAPAKPSVRLSTPASTPSPAKIQRLPNAGSQTMVQVLLQLPGGMTVPVQVPAANIVSPKQVGLASQPVVQNSIPIQSNVSVQNKVPVQNNIPVPKPQVIQAVYQDATTLMVAGNQLALQTVQESIVHTQQTVNKQTSQSSLPITVRTVSLGTNQTVPNPTQTGPNVISNVINQPQIVIQPTPGAQSAGNLATKVAPPRVSFSQRKVQSGSQSYTKQRLKAALQQQQASQQHAHILEVNEIKQELNTEQDNQSMVSSSGSVSSPEERAYLRMQDMADPNEDPETRRKKFLERNRAAAAKCRQKRKYWINTLETKADDLATQNNKLCTEVKSLRSEVATLKTLLIAHKDCPVTAQQRQQGLINAVTLNMDRQKRPEEAKVENVIQIIDDSSCTEKSNTSMLPSMVIANSTDRPGTGLGTNDDVQNVISVNSVPVNNNASNNIRGPTVIPKDGRVNGSLVAVNQLTSLPQFVTVNPSSVQETPTTLSVITGPNTIGLLPKLFNFEQIIQNHANQTS